jgi:tetratricopeptide (TPR) repeat protein
MRDNKTICSLCCAKIRGPDCGDCPHYAAAHRYAESKTRRSSTKTFIAEIVPEVEDAAERAFALMEEGRIGEAEAIIADLEKGARRNHTVCYARGLIHVLKEEYRAAIDCFDKAIAIFPYYIEAHFNKAMACKVTRDLVTMVKEFREVIAISDPGHELVREARKNIDSLAQSIRKVEGIDLDAFMKCGEMFERACCCMTKQEWTKAAACFQACLGMHPRHVQSYGNLGICYAQLGQRGKALQVLDKALEINPRYAPALTNRPAIKSLAEGEALGGRGIVVE